MDDCIFCKIANKEIPAEVIWESENFVAFLDMRPFSKGMTLVVPKKHYPSNITLVPADVISQIALAGQEVSKILEKALGCERVIQGFEGLEINHLHLKMFPSYNQSLAEITNTKATLANPEDLKILADKIRSVIL